MRLSSSSLEMNSLSASDQLPIPKQNTRRLTYPTQSSSPHLPFGENKNADWYGKDILSVKQFTREDLEYVFGVAHEMRGMVERVGTFDLLKGKILANLFYEPSTRTSSSFTAAVGQPSGSVIPINEVKYSSGVERREPARYGSHARMLPGR